MTKLEKLKELLNLPVEELAEQLAGYADKSYGDVASELSYLYLESYDAGGDYCLENHEDCEFLDSYYDSECPDFYGYCSCGGECPYNVSRHDIQKKYIIEDLLTEVKS